MLVNAFVICRLDYCNSIWYPYIFLIKKFLLNVFGQIGGHENEVKKSELKPTVAHQAGGCTHDATIGVDGTAGTHL